MPFTVLGLQHISAGCSPVDRLERNLPGGSSCTRNGQTGSYLTLTGAAMQRMTVVGS